MKNKRFNKVVSVVLALMLMFNMFTTTALATGTPSNEDMVYVTVSFDGQFLQYGDEDKPLAYVGVPMSELKGIDLNQYGLGEYVYDADGDGEYEITALHLDVYTHVKILGLEWDPSNIQGAPGSIFFARGLFDFSDCNLVYYHNGTYPSIDGWGITADRIVLSAGDYLDVAGFTSWGFYGDSGAGFRYFLDSNEKIVHNFTVESGSTCELTLGRATFDLFSGVSLGYAMEADCNIYYGKSIGEAEGTVTTDENGAFEVLLPEVGTWYLWCGGGEGLDMDYGNIVSSPAISIVNVTENPDEVKAREAKEAIEAIGTVTLEKEELVKNAREVYDALTDEQKVLVSEETLEILTKAEAEIERLKQMEADEIVAEPVEKAIANIGEVTAFSAAKIKEARQQYDALTDSQKEYVTNVATLLAAEDELKAIYGEAAEADYMAIYKKTGELLASLGTPTVGSTGGEWMVIGLTRSGKECPEGYYENVVEFVKENINDKEQLHRSKSTENARVILGLTSAGYDVTDVAGHNLLMGLTDMDYLKIQGINGPIWALIAFDSYDYEIPVNDKANDQVTREKLIQHLLDSQLENGGWALSGRGYDPDITGMAIQALAPYYETNEDVKVAVDEALAMLSEIQADNGGFSGVQDGTSSESCVQVLVALTALGIDPEEDERFIKNGMSVIDALCLFSIEDGGFVHIPFGEFNGMATEQGYYAIASYVRMLNGDTSLYDMTDVEMNIENETNPENGATGEGVTDDTQNNNGTNSGLAQKPAEAPATGDANSIATWFAVMAVAITGAAIIRRREN